MSEVTKKSDTSSSQMRLLGGTPHIFVFVISYWYYYHHYCHSWSICCCSEFADTKLFTWINVCVGIREITEWLKARIWIFSGLHSLLCGLPTGGICIRPSLIDDGSWNNGNRYPSWGVAEIQKMSPPTTEDVIVVANSPPIGLMRCKLTNHHLGIVLDVRAWS